MNSKALREQFLKLFDHTTTLEEKADKMMSLVKDHVEYIVGEDVKLYNPINRKEVKHGEQVTIDFSDGTDSPVFQASAKFIEDNGRNNLRAEQRNRGGSY